MKKITSLISNAVLLLCFLFSLNTISQTVLGTYDFETGMEGWTLGGGDSFRAADASRAYSGTYSLQVRDNSGNASSVNSPATYALNAYDKVDFKFFFSSYDMESLEDFFIEYRPDGVTAWANVATFVANNISGKNADFQRDDYSKTQYSKTVTLLKTNYTFPVAATGQFRVRCDGSDDNDRIYMDLVTITGTTFSAPSKGPGGVTTNLDLWLQADKLDGTTVGTDGANVSKWTDTGKGNHAETVVSGQEPVYRNNVSKNINFNPVIEFENNHNTAAADMRNINTRDELMGTSGFNSNDMFLVVIPDPTITTAMYPLDTFTSSDPNSFTYAEDVTGVGFGGYTQRLTGEYFTYCIGTSSGTGPFVGYGSGDLTGTNNYNQFNIINVRHNSTNSNMEIYLNANAVTTTVNDLPSYAAVNNRKYWLGRSQYWNGSFDGRMAELITYDSRKTDGVTERNRIESYLALKYGITLGVNGVSQNYIDSNGNIVWDAVNSVGYCYDIAGIFRDDSSNHSQKQSKSINSTSVVTIGHKDISTTNSANTNSFSTDRDYLVWGHNNAALTGSNVINVNLGASSTSVTTLFDRRWKIYESRPTGGNDILEVKVSIPGAVLPAMSDPTTEEYAMIVSSDAAFGAGHIVDVIPLTANGSDYETWYDFDYTKFFTFGIASKVSGKFDVEFSAGDFLVGEDYVDLNSDYTVSSWVKNTGSGGSIVSKGTAYDFKINGSGKVQAVLNGTTRLTSSTTVNDSKWHHVAFSYTGSTLRLYIDGVEDGNSPSTSVPVPTSTTHRFAIGINYTDKNNFTTAFSGSIDEVRVWDSALSSMEIQYIMNQEIIEHTDNTVDGAVLPHNITRNEVNSIPWGDLQAYHNINAFYGTTVEDGSNNDNWVRIKYLVRGKAVIDNQTSPLPYGSNGAGNWTTNTTWKNGTELYIPGSASIVDPNVTVDWNIASISHDVTMDNSSLPAVNLNNRSLLGLIADSTNELTISSDNAVTVTHYLELNGSIDLEGESQLIQTDKSVLEVGANGSLERDQQGTADTYTYNYWSAPVGAINSSATNDTYTHRFTIPDVLNDGTNPASPGAINFITTGYNGNSSPFGIADYWIWKFANQLDDDYSSWQHMRSTGTIYAGEGYTMKGPGTGSILTPQNYIFEGKPNNGDITLNISAGNDYLVGNPYPSALDAHEFISDNPDTSGTLYYWEHWGGGSHNSFDYQGGYALYNYSGGVPTASYGTNDPDVGTGGTPTKLPGRYIPVSQGFFVYSAGGGAVTFENDQRVFEKESATSVFVRTSSSSAAEPVDYNEDNRMKFRIGFDSFNQIHRQLLLTVDENASNGVDWGYDGPQNRLEMDDMFWLIEAEKYGIQGVNSVTAESVFPLGIHVRDNGPNSIRIDHLENVPDNVQIYVRDNELNIYHNLRQSEYEFNLNTGEYLDRFEIVFSNRQEASLDIFDIVLNDSFDIFYNNDNSNLVVGNSHLIEINSIELYNIIGQSIYSSNNIELKDYNEIKLSNLSSGTYIINMDTAQGKLSKKVLVE